MFLPHTFVRHPADRPLAIPENDRSGCPVRKTDAHRVGNTEPEVVQDVSN
jgi:hypothetical protein